MDLSYFFTPSEDTALLPTEPYHFGGHIDYYHLSFPEWSQADIVIFGCQEDRGSVAPGAADAPDVIRRSVYAMAPPNTLLKIADLGNLKIRETPQATYEAIAYIVEALTQHNKTVIILGGSHDIAYGAYLGFEHSEQMIEYVSVDYSPDIYDAEQAMTNRSFNHRILTHSPNYLYHFTLLGAQNHYVTQEERQAFQRLHLEMLRVGELHRNIRRSEPYLRTANLIAFDVSVVRAADAPGAAQPSPAGITAEEACQVARFAGMGFQGNVFCISEFIPDYDYRGITAELCAMLVWYFIEGFYHRTEDAPNSDRTNLIKYRAVLSGPVPEIVFYRHEHTNRWWMEVPSPQFVLNQRGRQKLVACSADDYETALRDEIPERWWIIHYKFG